MTKPRKACLLFFFSLLLWAGCDTSTNPKPHRLELPGTTWKLAQAKIKGGQYNNGVKTSIDSSLDDSIEIAELGNDFGYFNLVSFLNTDSIKLHSSMTGHQVVAEYIRQNSEISANLKKDPQDEGTNLVFTVTGDTCLLLDYPGVYVSIQSSMGVVMCRTFESTAARDDFVAVFDSLYGNTGPADTVSYISYEYIYMKQ